jgi:hypothetical protein
MNVFQLTYDARLRSWYDLRADLEGTLIQNVCVEVDNWWQQAPLVNHHLHLLDSEAWPDPWQLLVENTYCTVARALGMCYTLLLLGIDDIEIVEATNETGEDVVLVLVDNAKYILNYWPDTVLSNNLSNFNIKHTVSIDKIKRKI